MNDHEGLQQISLLSGDDSVTVWVEIADEPEEYSRGLMGRTELAENRGMLFIFPTPKKLSFWMKNTLIPLDVLYFDAAGNFVSLQTMDPCIKNPCHTYPSAGPSQYALEVNAGFAKEKGIGEGWRLVLERF